MEPLEMKDSKKLTAEKIAAAIDLHIANIGNEFRNGFELLQKYPKSITIFGSSHCTPASPHYRAAQELAGRIVKELGYSIITGGGPGIMAAANLGALEAKGNSIGLAIDLPSEQHTNPYTTSNIHFNYFFTRKAMLAFAAEAYVFFPGGFGTFDELFGLLTLIQTKKIPSVPIILVGKDFWNPFKKFLTEHMLEKHYAISPDDMNLFVVTDNMDKILEIIKKAEVSEWWEKMD